LNKSLVTLGDLRTIVEEVKWNNMRKAVGQCVHLFHSVDAHGLHPAALGGFLLVIIISMEMLVTKKQKEPKKPPPPELVQIDGESLQYIT
jgi:hypothetical protein